MYSLGAGCKGGPALQVLSRQHIKECGDRTSNKDGSSPVAKGIEKSGYVTGWLTYDEK